MRTEQSPARSIDRRCALCSFRAVSPSISWPGCSQHRTSDEFDELAMAIGAAAPITVVDGDPDAFRADLPRDAEFVEAIIASRRPDPHES